MTQIRIAIMPLSTYPEAVADGSIQAAAAFTTSLKCALTVTTFAVNIPYMSSALGGLLIDIPGLVRAAEEKSKAECLRLQSLVQKAVGSSSVVCCTTRKVILGAALEEAAAEARYFDLALLPWSGDAVTGSDMTQAVIFGSGRPAVLVPPSTVPATLDHIAIAWDASRVASRVLGDALPLLAEGGRITVFTVLGEKPLSGSDLTGALASSLEKRGIEAACVEITLGKRAIAEALQETARSAGAQVLAMGAFGHSRVRDFVLGGATKGVLADLRMPVLLSH